MPTLTKIHYGEPYFLDSFRDSLTHPVVFYGKEDEEALLRYLDDVHMDPKVVVWEASQEFKPSASWVKKYPDDTSPLEVHFLFYGPKLPAAYQAPTKFSFQEYKTPKPFGKDFEVFFAKEAKRWGYIVPDSYLPVIVDFVGEDLYRLAAEAKKIGYLTPKNTEVSQETLKMVLTPGAITSPFPVCEAFLQGDVKRLFQLLDRYQEQEGSEGFFPLLSALTKQVEKMISVLSLLLSGLDSDQVADRVGMNPWRFKNHWYPYVRKFSIEDLRLFYCELLVVEFRVKTGQPFQVLFESSMLKCLKV